MRSFVRLTSRSGDGTPGLRRKVAGLQVEVTVGRVHFIVPRSLHANTREFPFTGNTASRAKIDACVHFNLNRMLGVTGYVLLEVACLGSVAEMLVEAPRTSCSQTNKHATGVLCPRFKVFHEKPTDALATAGLNNEYLIHPCCIAIGVERRAP